MGVRFPASHPSRSPPTVISMNAMLRQRSWRPRDGTEVRIEPAAGGETSNTYTPCHIRERIRR